MVQAKIGDQTKQSSLYQYMADKKDIFTGCDITSASQDLDEWLVFFPPL